MADRETNVTNAFESALTADLIEGGTTVEVESTVGSPGIPFYLVIDPGDDSKREIVLVDGSKDADTFLLSGGSSRGLDGTSDVAHDSGAVVGVYPIAGLWTDINDRVDAAESGISSHTHDGSGSTAVALSDVTGHNAAAHDTFRLVGELVPYAGTSVPSGFLACDGSAVSRTTYADLFSAIGTTWGVGDGTTTFNVPDLQEKVAIGTSGSFAVGASGGSATHVHAQTATDASAGHIHTQTATDVGGSHSHTNPDVDSGGSHTHSGTGLSTGNAGSHSHSNPASSSNGNHTHSNPSTGAEGGHRHGIPESDSAGSHSHTTGGPSVTRALSFSTSTNSASENHTHSVSTASSHTHTFAQITDSPGDHSHSVGTSGSGGAHTHTIGNTGSQADHSHSIPTSASGGSHVHTQGATGTEAGHTHSNPATASGGGHSHTQPDSDATSSYPPYAVVTWLIRY